MSSPVLIAQTEVAGTRAVLVDVRTPAEYATAHVPGAVTVPLPLVREHADALAAALDGPVVLLCQAGSRARTAHAAPTEAGAGRLSVLDGGMDAHSASGRPVRRGRQTWALERQVRLDDVVRVLSSATTR